MLFNALSTVCWAGIQRVVHVVAAVSRDGRAVTMETDYRVGSTRSAHKKTDLSGPAFFRPRREDRPGLTAKIGSLNTSSLPRFPDVSRTKS